jgi:hypothetical protein
VSSTRALADIIITSVLAREGKRRWCEVCLAKPEVAEEFLRIYPATRFVCLYRSCGDVIRAVLDASPWGVADPVFAPFVMAHPASTAAALTAYWAAHTASLLAFEQAHPRAVLRIRFEDLAADERRAARAVTSFLGVAVPEREHEPVHDSQAARPEPGRVARPEAGIPAGLIPPALLARANDLLRQLGYPVMPG